MADDVTLANSEHGAPALSPTASKSRTPIDAVGAWIRNLFWVPTSPVNPAVLRIVVFSTLGYLTYVSHASSFARLPASLLDPPEILGSTLVALPRSPGLVSVVTGIVVVGCALAVVGFQTKVAALTASLLSIYVLGIPQLYGKVDHYHHVVVLALLLALTPCADALAIDALRKPRPPRSLVYGFPIRIAWLVIGFCYLFPGLSKLVHHSTWLTAANMRGLINAQQWIVGRGIFVPDRLLVPAAVGAIVFEIGFVFAVFNRRLRYWALGAAILFHLSTWVVLDINFWVLWVCFVAFIDWAPKDQRVDERNPSKLQLGFSAVAIAGIVFTGATFEQWAWPVACYPTFAGDSRNVTQSTKEQIIAVTDGRRERIEVLPWLPVSRRPFLIARAIQHPRTLAEFGREVAPHSDRIEVWAVAESVLPANRGHVLARVKVFEVTTHPSR